MPEYTINEHNLHIVDSHKIGKFSMCKVLKDIRAEHPDSLVWERCMFSLYNEWVCHNFLYMIGFERERTGSVDLDNPCDHPEWMYIVGGILVWPFTFKTK